MNALRFALDVNTLEAASVRSAIAGWVQNADQCKKRVP